MKISVFTFILVLTGFAMTHAQSQKKNSQLRHVVLFSFKDSSSEADINNVIREFEALPSRIKQIKALEWGLNNSPENLNEGLTHAFVLTFASEKDRDDYLVHPEHKKFGEIAGPHIQKVVVVDFWKK